MERNFCLICNSAQKETLFETFDRRFELVEKKAKSYRLVRCLNCGFVFLDFIPTTKKELSQIYPAEYWQASAGSLFGRLALDFVIWSKYRRIIKFKRQGKLLDVGCGTGELLSFFNKKSWTVYGQDIFPPACEKARKKVENLFCGPLSEADFQPNSFDVVLLNSVLHQMTDPLKELSFIRKFIKKDGVLMISVSDVSSWQFIFSGKNWFHLDSPRHLFYFQPDSIGIFLKKSGFEVKRISRPYWECPLDFFHSCRDYLPRILHPVFLPLSLLLRTVPKFRGIMEVVAVPV